jgi:three-Cys-motif partner protein
LFLDPYGMDVSWKTIEAIANTRAIDLWYLFPLGVGVNRLLKNDGKITPGRLKKLNSIFGTTNWIDEFYKTKTVSHLFGEDEITRKIVDNDYISKYIVKRLKTVFTGVAENPLKLFNVKRNPIYLLCFACGGNERAVQLALRIANNILEREKYGN